MLAEKEKLKENLKRIQQNEYNLKENESPFEYLDLMLKYIGDPDKELRDELICSTLSNWIEEKSYLSDEEKIDLLDKVLSKEFIFYNIGNENEDSVLRRSFAILLVNSILYAHLVNNFLDINMIIKAKDSIIKYINEEKDLRGYDQEKGWLHALAHVADSVALLVNFKELDEKAYEDLILAIGNRICQGKDSICFDEDERIVNSIYNYIIEEKLLPNETLCNWIRSFDRVLEIEDRITKFKAKRNVRNFIRSLYFRMIHLNENKDISDEIVKLDKKLNPYCQ